MQIQFREYQHKDFQLLSNVVRKTWNYDKFLAPKISQKLSSVFLSSCLTNYTFSRVALDSGKPIGIILVNNKHKHKCPISLKIQKAKHIISLLLSKKGRETAKIFGTVSDIYKELFKECNKKYPAELALFAVDPNYQGKGVGKKLFELAITYMKKNRIKEFYLFTDTSCNYGFYEHNGMKRKQEKMHIFNVHGQTAKINFFIYEHKI